MGYLAQYLSRFDPLLLDPSTIEIAINADGGIWVEHAGDVHMHLHDGPPLTQSQAADLAQSIANMRQEKLTCQNPMVPTSVDYQDLSLRIQIIAPPACANGTAISIRLFQAQTSEEPKRFSLLRGRGVALETCCTQKLSEIKKQLQTGTEDEFLRACVDNRLNMIIAGGTSSGKTELGRRLLWMTDLHERLVTIEDAPELLPRQANTVSLLASRDADSPRSAELLLQASLRLRPDRIILGELRGREAATFLQAINTGHSGSFTTLHAETARKAFDRLALMVMESGMRLRYPEVLRYLQGAIDVVIETGRVGKVRGILEVWFPNL